MDYSISWGYIVKRMQEKFGVAPDDFVRVPYAEIREMIEQIWTEYFLKIYKDDPENLTRNWK